MKYSPKTDGLDHINIYSQAKTPLGQMLSNFYYVPIQTRDGEFHSIEGYWQWLSIGGAIPHIGKCTGGEAKRLGQIWLSVNPRVEVPDFEAKIIEAIYLKLEAVSGLKDVIRKSTLPFAHYYVFKDQVVPAGPKWLVPLWTQIRADLRA